VRPLVSRRLPLPHAVALGLLQGPTELLPISSSAHTTLVPWLLGWPYGKLEDPKLRKSFEVALHAGTAAALLTGPRGIPLGGRPSLLLPAVAPAALAGYALGDKIERRFGTPGTIATGLLAGSIAMTAAELRARKVRLASRARARVTPFRTTTTPSHDAQKAAPAGRWARYGEARDAATANRHDGLALGLAQAVALVPGVSRSGATIAAARARGFSRIDADRLSWQVGLPVIAGAALLKGMRLAREGVPRELRVPLLAGAASAFASTLLSARLLGFRQRALLLPASTTYRGVLAGLVVRRMRDNTT
jgi:undecaprenyl-diphosphatase